MVEGQHVYRRTRKRLRIVRLLEQATGDLQAAAVGLEEGGYPHDAHRVRNVAQSASARKELMELTWQQEDEKEVKTKKPGA
ncbi:MAG: hypothetical protein QOG00_249 [Pyrinomonadaceae bacterium]|nr:hypothetical protein [Pyrinomonadaceae bacterium]